MTPRLKLTGIRKAFGATQALRGVTLEVAPGEVHALIGENGAGKSTLMKVLSGAHAADGGEIELDGQPFTPRDPLHARRCGVAMIYQELTLAPHLSVEENLLLGEEPARFGWIDGAAGANSPAPRWPNWTPRTSRSTRRSANFRSRDNSLSRSPARWSANRRC